MKSVIASRIEKISSAVVSDAMRRIAGTGNFPRDAEFAYQENLDPDDKDLKKEYEDVVGHEVDWDDHDYVEEYKNWVYDLENQYTSDAYSEVKQAIDYLPDYKFWEVELGDGYYAGFYVRIVEKDNYYDDDDDDDGITSESEYDKVYEAVKKIAKDYGMKAYGHVGTFSNGESIYRLTEID